jgi:two-component system response regulator FixJ
MRDQSRPVYIVDDNPDVLRVLGTMLSREGWSVHVFESPTRFLGQLGELPGGVVIVDQVMGEMDGLELLQKLSDKQRQYRAILVSGYPRTSTTVAALRMGVLTVLDKPVDRRELLHAVAEASQQLRPAAEEDQLLPPPLPDGRFLIDLLTPREKQVILRVFRGWKNKAISLQLDLSIKTVEKFRSRAMQKLGVRSTALLVRVLTREIERGCRLE